MIHYEKDDDGKEERGEKQRERGKDGLKIGWEKKRGADEKTKIEETSKYTYTYTLTYTHIHTHIHIPNTHSQTSINNININININLFPDSLECVLCNWRGQCMPESQFSLPNPFLLNEIIIIMFKLDLPESSCRNVGACNGRVIDLAVVFEIGDPLLCPMLHLIPQDDPYTCRSLPGYKHNRMIRVN